MNKPVDPDELFYLLRSIYEDEADMANMSIEAGAQTGLMAVAAASAILGRLSHPGEVTEK